MATKPTKKQLVMTPRVAFRYPKLTEMDYGSKDYPKEFGEYNVRFRLQKDAPETQAFLKKLEPFRQTAIEQGQERFDALKPAAKKKLGEMKVNDIYETVFDEDENETGEIEFKAKMKGEGKNKKTGKKWSRKVTMFDAHLKPIKGDIEIWGGTEGKIRLDPVPYFVDGQGTAGLSLYIDAVQIIELRGPGMGGASAEGFEEEEGFSRDDLAEDDETPEDDSDDTDVEDEGNDEPDGEDDF